MPFSTTEFPGLVIFEPSVFTDERGYFFESFNELVFANQGISSRFVQDNQSCSKYGVIRGLHYQLNPHAQSKLVRVLQGKILDVVVDLRRGSPTEGKVFGLELSSENKKQLFIPAGFAHGFSVLGDMAEIMYKCDTFYHKESEAGIIYNDSELKIDWKIEPGKEIVSAKDILLPSISTCRNNFTFSG